MDRDTVLNILESLIDDQERSILGGIVGGEEYEQYAREDLNKYRKAYQYAKKNLK